LLSDTKKKQSREAPELGGVRSGKAAVDVRFTL